MPVGRRSPEYEEDFADPGASFMAQIPWYAWVTEANPEMGPETGFAEVLAIWSGVLG